MWRASTSSGWWRSTCTRTPRSRAAASTPCRRSCARRRAVLRRDGPPTAEDVAAYYRERNMAAVVFTVDSESATGTPPIPNEEIAEVAAANPDVLIPFASIDPRRGASGVAAARRLIGDYGVQGFKFHPNSQAFFPNDRGVYPLYEAIEAAGLPALFHTGHTGIGAGLPRRRRHPAEVLQPDVPRRRRGRLPRTEDHPRPPVLPLAGRGPLRGAPQAERLHRPLRLVAEVLPAELVQYANTLLRTRSSSAPTSRCITPDRWLADFDELPIKDEVRPLILKENAIRLLGLA